MKVNGVPAMAVAVDALVMVGVSHAAPLTAGEISVDSPPWRIDSSATLEADLRSDGMRRLGAIVAVDSDGILRGVLTLPSIRRAMNPSAAV